MGKLPYSAPEQDADCTLPASDQYQLACLAYDWLRNWRDSSEDSPIAVSAILQVLERARTPDYKQRYPRIQDFGQALERAYTEGTEKFPPSVTLSPHPPTRRRISPVWSAVTLFLLTILVVSGLLIGQSIKQHIASALTPTSLITTDPQALYTSVMHSSPTLDNPSAGNGPNQWSLTSDRFGGPLSPLVECFINTLTVQSFAFQTEIDFLRVGTEAGHMEAGLLMRQNLAKGTGYYFFLDTAFYNCNFAPRLDQVQRMGCPSSKGVGATNVLTVIALQSMFYLYINDTHVEIIKNGKDQSGALGVFLSGDTTNLDVGFKNVKIWTL